jgi:predicted regulator of Ras-like GTPase activity (Roadblock/LC7/MglB family)
VESGDLHVTTQQRLKNMDWLLKDLAVTVPCTRHVVLLSADGPCPARSGTDKDTADRLAAASSGLTSPARSVAAEFPRGEGGVRMVAPEVDGGFLYLMAAAANSYLAVTADEGVDAGLMSRCMRDLVIRIGDHLAGPPRAPPRAPEQAP